MSAVTLPIGELAARLEISPEQAAALAAAGVLKPIPGNAALYDPAHARACLKAYEEGDDPPSPPKARPSRRKEAKPAEPAAPSPGGEEDAALQAALNRPPTMDELNQMNPKARALYRKTLASARREELALAREAGDLVEVRQARRDAKDAVMGASKVIDGLPDQVIPALVKAGIKDRKTAHTIMRAAVKWLKAGIEDQFDRAGRRTGRKDE